MSAIEAVCVISHEPVGSPAGAVIEVFPDMQAALNRGLEESYPLCIIEYREARSER